MPAPLVVAHRGASGWRPEHTESAYRLAAQLGADAIEPDIVATRDGVLVLRHENEISGTTDVAERPEFRERRATKRIDGVELTGWFTEDFTWDELRTLRTRERLPGTRPNGRSFDGLGRILRLRDLLAILDETGLGLVAEVKHATYFDSIGLPLGELVASELARHGWARGRRLVVEAFEQSVVDDIRARGVEAEWIYLVEAQGAAADLVARFGAKATSYADQVSDAGLARLRESVDGISVDKSMLFNRLAIPGARPRPSDLTARAHAAGLKLFTWTLRPENRFLLPAHRVGKTGAEWGDWRREWGMVLDQDVDGVFADHPDLVRELLRERAGEA